MRCGIYVRVSTEDQKDNGYSIDSQLRMIKEYCEKNNYDIIDIYNDAGYSGKNLIRPDMQRLIKDIAAKKLDKLIAIKVDRLTRNNLDGFWLLNYCEQNNVKIELILEPYDVSTANGEMIYGMNLIFGQRERKEIGARTKRALEEMALEKVHPGKAPYGYTRNKITGHLEINPIEALVVKEIFELCKKGESIRNIAFTMEQNNAYLDKGKWTFSRVYKILTNSIYIGIFEFGKYKRKPEDILKIENYCEPIIDLKTWKLTRSYLEKNKHSNYGEHIHLFTSIIRCPECNKILSSTNSFKYSGTPKERVYYHLTCKNPNCKAKGLHYNSDKIEQKLGRILNELTRYMYDNTNEIITSTTTKSKEISDIDKAIEKLKQQEKRLIDLYLDSNLDVNSINLKNEAIKKEINKLNLRKMQLNPDDNFKEYTLELLKKLDCKLEKNEVIFYNNLGFSFLWDTLNRKAKQELIKKIIAQIDITRDKNYNIEIKNIKFTDEFISKNKQEYIEYLNGILQNNNMGFIYKPKIEKKELLNYSKNYIIISYTKFKNNNYSQKEMNTYMELMKEHFYKDGIINCPCTENNNVIDLLFLIPKNQV